MPRKERNVPKATRRRIRTIPNIPPILVTPTPIQEAPPMSRKDRARILQGWRRRTIRGSIVKQAVRSQVRSIMCEGDGFP